MPSSILEGFFSFFFKWNITIRKNCRMQGFKISHIKIARAGTITTFPQLERMLNYSLTSPPPHPSPP